jgi:hypothetical protein
MAGPEVNATQLRNNGWITVPWAEVTTKDSTAQDASLSFEGGSQFTMVIQVFWTDLPQALRDILGTVTIDNSDSLNLKLSRTTPVQHPIFPNFYANRVSGIRPIKIAGKFEGDSAYNPSYTTYLFAFITIVFQVPRWNNVGDSDLDGRYGTSPRAEWERMVEWRTEMNTDAIVRDGNSAWKWADNSPGQPVSAPPFGEAYPSPVGQLLRHVEFTLIWKRVPKAGLFAGGGNGLPVNLMLAAESVNVNPWPATWDASNQFPAGCLKCRAPRLIPIDNPLATGGPLVIIDGGYGNLGPPVGAPSLLYDVEIPMTYFRPQTYVSSVTGNPSQFQGHNLAFHKDNLWYLVKDLATGTNTIYPSTDFNNIFKIMGSTTITF